MTGEEVFRLLGGPRPKIGKRTQVLAGGQTIEWPVYLPQDGKDLIDMNEKEEIGGWFEKEGLYAQEAVDIKDVLVKDKKDDSTVFTLTAEEIMACKNRDDLETLLNKKYYAARPY